MPRSSSSRHRSRIAAGRLAELAGQRDHQVGAAGDRPGRAPSASAAYASARSRGLVTGGSTGIGAQRASAATATVRRRAGSATATIPKPTASCFGETAPRSAGSVGSNGAVGGSAVGRLAASGASGADRVRRPAVGRDRDAIGVVAHRGLPRLPRSAIASTILV